MNVLVNGLVIVFTVVTKKIGNPYVIITKGFPAFNVMSERHRTAAIPGLFGRYRNFMGSILWVT
jgi:hypothetical protein